MRTRKGEIAMRRSILVILLVFLIPFGAYAHEGMIALVADPAMLDCDDGIEPGTKVITRGNERIFPGQPVAGEPQEYELP